LGVKTKINDTNLPRPRTKITDEQWPKIRDMLIEVGLYYKPNLRKTVEGLIYRIRIGCPWRDLPPQFGRWNSVYRCYNQWSKRGIFKKMFEIISQDSDQEWVAIDGSIVKAHQHASGAQKGQDAAIGKSVAGNTTKIHMLVDAFGWPKDFKITEGQVHDIKMAPDLLSDLTPGTIVLADKGYDSDELRDLIKQRFSAPVIPKRKNSKTPNPDFDSALYKLRFLVENVFAKLKHYRGIATRYDKLARNFLAALQIVCFLVWMPLQL